ncbi:hypothetical protein [Deminuibacter soli]|uniref:Glycosyltransferase RgtA/B/C/D-like domain-containing protein n=1 Tax=Deminuibacter soli TaxID=2291815 RepID=A0A3E1NEL4_9BACT|nr:hypothetical protein [Deminuibacter soli]RFM26317.1 hypothetical protein DXN05_20625 [Deminuibacter soli]
MRTHLSFISPRLNYDALFFALAGFMLVQLFAHYGGIGISPDSVVYTSTARSIYAHTGIRDYNHMPLIDFPVLYPLFLGTVYRITGVDPLPAGPYINGALFGMLIYLCGCMMQRWKYNNRWYKIFILGCITISPALLEVYYMLWSETLFIFLSIVFMALLRRYCNTHSIPSLLAVGFCASTACITRYAGVTLIGTGGLILLMDNTLPWKKKAAHIILFGFTAISLLVINLYVNFGYSHTLTGPREKGITPFSANLHYFSTVMCDWLPFMRNHYGIASLIGGALVAGSACLIGYRWLRNKNVRSYENIATVFFFGYAAFMLLSATISRYETINSRLLSPLYIPLLWTFTSWVPVVFKRLNRTVRVRLGVALTAGGLFFWAGEYAFSRYMYNEVRDFGIAGYTDDSWRLSPFCQYLKQHHELFKPNYSIFSNASDALYFVTGVTGISLPHTNSPGDINDYVTNPEHYVVWFRNVDDQDLLSEQYIRQSKHTEVVYETTDGVVYWCTGPGK